MFNNIKQRQLEARLALKMEKMSKKEGGDVVKTDNGYEWKDKNGETIIKVTSF